MLRQPGISYTFKNMVGDLHVCVAVEKKQAKRFKQKETRTELVLYAVHFEDVKCIQEQILVDMPDAYFVSTRS